LIKHQFGPATLDYACPVKETWDAVTRSRSLMYGVVSDAWEPPQPVHETTASRSAIRWPAGEDPRCVSFRSNVKPLHSL